MTFALQIFFSSKTFGRHGQLGLTPLLNIHGCFLSFHNGVKILGIVTPPSRRENWTDVAFVTYWTLRFFITVEIHQIFAVFTKICSPFLVWNIIWFKVVTRYYRMSRKSILLEEAAHWADQLIFHRNIA